MTFYGPTFPNETHYEKLFSGRQRFGNRSANMFFVRPARHIACPRRLKYIHDIKTGYIPYVEDSVYDHRPAYRYAIQKAQEEEKSRMTALGLYNSSDVWRQELMDLAQQVKATFTTSDDDDGHHHSHQIRSSRLQQRFHRKRNTSSALSNYSEENEEQQSPRRLLTRRGQNSTQRLLSCKPKITVEKEKEKEKTEPETSTNDENQDPGIWLIPILCYVLQIDNIGEAQEWLVNANPTEKRLAMELISRTMQDMQQQESDVATDISALETSSTSSTTNNVYWPYKVWQKQERQRQQILRQSKTNTPNGLPPLPIDTNDTCERSTSPLRIVTPGKRSSSVNDFAAASETLTSERLIQRKLIDRITSGQPQRNPSPVPEPSKIAVKRSLSTTNHPLPTERQSRRGYRVATSVSHSIHASNKSTSPVARGKTPLI